MRTPEYQKTHPWLTFEVDLRKAPVSLWLDLGEAASKCEHLAWMPLRADTGEALHKLYLVKGILATTAIEGNMLTEAEVNKLVEGTLRVSPSREYQKQEADNVLLAIQQLARQMEGLPPLSPKLIEDFNRQILDKLPLEKEIVPGKLRTHPVLVGTVYKGAPARECDDLLSRLCEWLNEPDFAFPAKDKSFRTRKVRAILKALLAHLYLAWIHPFGDGNGRTARLLEFYLLLCGGIPVPAALLLSNHYNKTRAEYYRQLDYASKSKGDVVPFLSYAVQGFVDGLEEQLGFVREQVWNLVWQDHVKESFREKKGVAASRQRLLVETLGHQGRMDDPLGRKVALMDLPRLMPEYRAAGPKTVQRDVTALVEMGLIERRGRSIRVRRDILFSFLPQRNWSNPGPG